MKKFIKLISLAMAMAFIFVIFAPAALASDTSDADYLVIQGTSVEGEVGEEVTVSLVVESNPGFAALIINISANQGIELVNVENGSVMATMTTGRNIVWDSASNSTVTGTLVELTYRITDAATVGENVIQVNAFECYNDTLGTVAVAVEPIIINVVDDSEQTTTGKVDTDNETNIAEETTTGEMNVTDNDSTVEEEPTTATTKDDNTEDKKAGCNAAISTGIFAFLLIPVAVIAIKRKDK